VDIGGILGGGEDGGVGRKWWEGVRWLAMVGQNMSSSEVYHKACWVARVDDAPIGSFNDRRRLG
jgi:hypothetical protein